MSVLTTAEALAAVLDSTTPSSSQVVALENATARVLRQTVTAERDQPPFDRVMMDGIAVRHADIEAGIRRFPIQGLQAAGDPTLTLQLGLCLEVMTGTTLPDNADCIIPVERISIADGAANVAADYATQAMRFVHRRGSDYAKGAHLLQPGKKISPLDIAVIASCGLATVEVAKNPVIRVISTGNELVAAGHTIADHQIRSSNGPALLSLLASNGFANATHDHIDDDVATLNERIANHLGEADVLVLSGGVSMGKADYVPGVLDDLGVTQIFHKISQRPGKPMWFGTGPRGQMVFALPGNPVSALVCCRQYVVPALRTAAGIQGSAPDIASLASNVSFKPDLTCFQPVRLVASAAGLVIAMPVKTNTSGDFAALSQTDGYVELAREQSEFAAGTPVFLHRWIWA